MQFEEHSSSWMISNESNLLVILDVQWQETSTPRSSDRAIDESSRRSFRVRPTQDMFLQLATLVRAASLRSILAVLARTAPRWILLGRSWMQVYARWTSISTSWRRGLGRNSGIDAVRRAESRLKMERRSSSAVETVYRPWRASPARTHPVDRVRKAQDQ